jgi:hypothetical protein
VGVSPDIPAAVCVSMCLFVSLFLIHIEQCGSILITRGLSVYYEGKWAHTDITFLNSITATSKKLKYNKSEHCVMRDY